ncbi:MULTISPECIES: ABC transporter ATP-binding protein [Clostridium]|uniref:Energy-coupling factor ABC transporter ATP-binding protein n=1 Tax=Clostridium sporogenes TaxID=1509 RepID=A0A7X5SVY5_CLOSG|nr:MULTISPECIES: energy-coupling factor ABC transporter ATP-binding protein [Clostridium]AJD31387.1 heme ABC exporter, ATP-binding protein CcmA [Clostridium botulinum Prevot_594]KOY64834.1 ABC transporter ATP-binding protein [Clostridium sporogenes]KRU47336.1 putative HMP/thiamine import ATP-binding protein YkoD [Clostridium sporogenes]MBE6056528.1 energy-coupling factor ABC transporter ATP-binding protein [Clostridium sp.]MBY7015960.1 energy-coupling factor ABC transporter ATP-binding protein
MIHIENVFFKYLEGEDYQLKNINLHVKPGECVLLCGKSGCGKTTVTKLINGLIPHFIQGEFEGKVISAGMDVENTKMYHLSSKIGSVFQNPKSQFFNIDSDSELAFCLENDGREPEYIKERISHTINDLKIDKLVNRNIFTMSGGEKQALAFASIYTVNPEIYVLDEPTANLDQKSIQILKTQLEKIKSLGKTIVIADHRLYYLADIIDRAVYMDKGKIVRIFEREEFLALKDNERIKMGLRMIKNTVTKHSNYVVSNKADLVISGLSYSIKKNPILKDISFSANEGDVIGILGNNGTGKTTLMRCLAGLIKENKGTVKLNGKCLNGKQRNKACYMIMQDVNHQLFSESVWNECTLSLEEIKEEVILDILKKFNLHIYKDNHPMALSGGQKQRLAIATGLLTDKKILIFDEPTSGLDYENMCVVSKMIKKLSKENHIIFIVTHDMEFLEITCNKTIIN